MPLRCSPPEDVLPLAGAIDHEGGALDTPEAPAVEILLLVGSVLSRDRGVLVREKRERKAELLGEPLVAQLVIQADPQHDRVLGLDAREGIAESTGFHAAAWRVVLGIEIEDDALAAEFGKGHAASQRAGKRELGSGHSHRQALAGIIEHVELAGLA